MADYIKRDDAIHAITQAELENQTCFVAGAAKQAIRSLPAADVAPVVPGRWEPRKDAPGFCNCSVCHNCNVYDDWPDGEKWNYCPQCGAKMDGGAEDGKN